MTARVCIVSTGQPSTNPRLVKEADALAATGFEVRVIGAHWADWADRADVELLARRPWRAHVIDWRRGSASWRFWMSRARHFARAVGVRHAASDRIARWMPRRAG